MLEGAVGVGCWLLHLPVAGGPACPPLAHAGHAEPAEHAESAGTAVHAEPAGAAAHAEPVGSGVACWGFALEKRACPPGTGPVLLCGTHLVWGPLSVVAALKQ